MKNKLTDLNDILFSQLERLNDETLSKEELAQEINRSSAIVNLADTIVENAQLQLDAAKFMHENGADSKKRLPASLGLPSGQEVPTGAGK